MEAASIPLISQEEQDKTKRHDASRPRNSRGWILGAWRFTVASGAFAGTWVLLVNIITLAVMYGRFDVVDYSITFFTGSCQTASTVTIVAHVIINILSTILLASSNFSMQCLGSPTRDEVDIAHSKHRWLSIGTPNIRNVFFVSKSKGLLWLVLGLSSFPLHTVWNSTVFETKTTNNYLAVTVTEDFLTGGQWAVPSPPLNSGNNDSDSVTRQYHDIVANLQHETEGSKSGNSSDQLERLDVKDCIEAYGQDKLSDRQHVLLVVDNNATDSNNTVLAIYDNAFIADGDPLFTWMCSSNSLGQEKKWSCASDTLKYDASHWVPGSTATRGSSHSAPIQYCYSQQTSEKCKASIVPIFLIIVIICNVLKIVSFLLTLRITRKNPPLCTTGDAIQSFIQKPDPHTKGRCLVSKYDYEKYTSTSPEWTARASNVGDLWEGGSWRWANAIHTWQWVLYTLCVCILILVAGLLFNPDENSVPWSIAATLGLGQPRASFLATHTAISSVLTGFIKANVPQLLVSYIYLALNNMMTTILAMAEWCAYSAGHQNTTGKPLRVSSPAPNTEQLSTYTLSVPLKWGLPTTICITVLHWLVSQMVFLASIDVYPITSDGTGTPSSIYDIFFSPLAMVLVVSVASATVVVLLGVAIFKKFPSSITLAGCCSASLAAACQPSSHAIETVTEEGPGFDSDLVNKRLRWGVVERSVDTEPDVGHATFAAQNVTPLEVGKLYA